MAYHGQPPVLLIDLDGPIKDAWTGFWTLWADRHPDAPQRADADTTKFHVEDQLPSRYRADVRAILDEPGFYAGLPDVPGAAQALNEMLDLGLDPYVCTAPRLTNPTCASDKIASVVQQVGAGWDARTIITRNKSLVRGDVLIDDKPTVRTTLTPTWVHVVFDDTYNQTAASPHRLRGWDNWQATVIPLLGRIAA